MVAAEIAFGDKLFIYGRYLAYLDGISSSEYNSLMGYMTVGGYIVSLQKTDIMSAAVPGFVVDFLSHPSLAFETPFANMEMIDVTNSLSLSTPITVGTKIWAPTTPPPAEYSYYEPEV